MFLEVDEISDLRLEDEIRPERSLYLPSASRRAHAPRRFYSEDWNEVQHEGEEWHLPDDLQRILKMVFCSRDIEINPMSCEFISNSVLNTKGADVVNIQTPYTNFV